MNNYELINMSDNITFCADNDDYARAVTLILGEGKCGCRTQDGNSIHYCMTAFHGEAPQEIYNQISNMLKTKDKKLIEALKTVAVCDFSEREIYEDYTENYTNQEKMIKWDDSHRTSINNFFRYSQNVAHRLSED